MTPRRAYGLLWERYGPQGWWPTTAPGAQAASYRARRYGPPPPREAFEVCAGAILTQNTAWTNVRRALESLRADGPLTAERLARLPARRLERLVRPSGYFRQKADRLRRFARWAGSAGALARSLRDEPLGELRARLLALKGVGPETADSMLLYGGARPVFVVDAYTRRIGARV
ncbi:MAG: hypothetical protein KGL53_01195, partial [Elusimicrobia bacterium]|nr:hypothetical protein [Elusimicrobiota bacterium]